MSGFFQGARDFFIGKSAETTLPALTQEGTSLGFEWEARSNKQEATALLWPQAPEDMEIGPLAGVDKAHPAAGWTVNGGEDLGLSRNEAMEIAEIDAATHYIEPLAQASESYYAGLTALAERKGVEMDLDASERNLDLDL